MALGGRSYSRLIAWLKVLLPLAALVLLSTMFLIARQSDPGGNLPPGRVAGDTLNEGVRAAYFAGTTERGDAITMTAAAARPDEDGVVLAEDLEAQLRLTDGSQITLQSAGATLSDGEARVALEGGVRVESTTGYEITTDRLIAAMDRIAVESDGPVKGKGPAGQFSAGRMEITAQDGDGDVRMLFTGGVELVYDPAN